MLEYIIICIGFVLAIFMWLIYKKIDQKKNNGDEIKSALDLERERKKDLNEVKEKILETINIGYLVLLIIKKIIKLRTSYLLKK